MRKIYTCIDIGTDTVKLVTIEVFNKKYNVLAATTIPSFGVKKGLIIDATAIGTQIKKLIKAHEAKLGTKIDRLLAIVPSNNIEINMTEGYVEIKEKIDGDDVFNCLQNAVKKFVSTDKEIVSVSPIEYKIDKERIVKNPLGETAKGLGVKAVATLVPKKNVYSVVGLLKVLNIEVIDIIVSSISDYYAVKSKEMDTKVVGIVNIGESKTDISVFNKGIIIKSSILPIGGANIDGDIAFTYKVEKESKKIKEDFAVSNRKYADSDDTYTCINRNGEKITINQYKLAELIETRIVDLLKNVKIELNSLTNREIGYIIITGGITSMLGFGAIVDELFTRNATVMNIGLLGIRENVYSTSYGAIKYFVDKLYMRDKEYTMLEEDSINEMTSTRKKAGSNNVLVKIFEKIFD